MTIVFIVVAFFAGIYAGKRRALRQWQAQDAHDRLLARLRQA